MIEVLVGAGIGPFTKPSLNEALGFAFGFGHLWPYEDLAQAQTGVGGPQGLGLVARSAFRHDALPADPSLACKQPQPERR
jgi:hypothetical protein